ncbi:MAG: hypothetical protein J0L69_08550 [Bacteroidetes bacterium]|nr:hypothetical protein [Bacteroidota bacterium]
MGAIMFGSMGIMIILCIPILTYFFAKRVGRNPWLWFGISLVLPVIATLILFVLPDLSETGNIEG